MLDIYVGRQAVYDRRLRAFGYELLVPHNPSLSPQSILNVFLDIGLDRLVGNRLAFLNIPREVILEGHASTLPKDRVVLEVREGAPPDDDTIAMLRKLVADGFKIALDDFVYSDSLLPLLRISKIAKIDVRMMNKVILQNHLDALKAHKVMAVATGVETQSDLDSAQNMGFDGFQGRFLCKPRLFHDKSVSPNRMNVLQLIAAFQKRDIAFKDVEDIIVRDVALSYKLLRCVNTAYFALPKKIESIRQALLFLGSQTILSWASLIAMGSVENKPHELLVNAMVRAKMCELLATSAQKELPERFFTVGLFSVLEALLERPMEEILEALPLSDDVKDVLLQTEQESDLSRALRCVLNYEENRWDSVGFGELSVADVRGAYLGAVSWATGISAGLQQAA